MFGKKARQRQVAWGAARAAYRSRTEDLQDQTRPSKDFIIEKRTDGTYSLLQMYMGVSYETEPCKWDSEEFSLEESLHEAFRLSNWIPSFEEKTNEQGRYDTYEAAEYAMNILRNPVAAQEWWKDGKRIKPYG